MISRVVRWAAVIASVLVAASFVWFAIDQADAASDNTVVGITGEQGKRHRASSTEIADPDRATERRRERENNGLREAIDDANDVLVGPFTGIVDSNNIWVQRAVPALIALFLYGFIGAMLARAIAARRL